MIIHADMFHRAIDLRQIVIPILLMPFIVFAILWFGLAYDWEDRFWEDADFWDNRLNANIGQTVSFALAPYHSNRPVCFDTGQRWTFDADPAHWTIYILRRDGDIERHNPGDDFTWGAPRCVVFSPDRQANFSISVTWE